LFSGRALPHHAAMQPHVPAHVPPGASRRWPLLVAGLLLPSTVLAALGARVAARRALPLDDATLLAAHAWSGPLLDRVFQVVSLLGYGYGVVPFEIVFVLVLAVRRHAREAWFAGLALWGSLLLNTPLKLVFERARPALWDPLERHATYSFPSGHAMATATLASVLILLYWRTRWRWRVVAASLALVALVGLSRVYLGVHYPSDVIGGWAFGVLWTVACFCAVFRQHRRPWQAFAKPPRARDLA
jgi:undecaprenyl-diphosphatase